MEHWGFFQWAVSLGVSAFVMWGCYSQGKLTGRVEGVRGGVREWTNRSTKDAGGIL